MSFFRRKNMKKYTYRKFLILLFMINLIAITAVYIKYCNARLPDTIHINKSETVSLCYDVPVSATIDHQTIRLNQPIVFKQCHMGQYEMKTNLFGTIPLKKIKVKVVDDQKITPSGEVIGVYVETDGLFVLDTDQFTGENSMEYAPSKNKLYRGDYIKKIDGKDKFFLYFANDASAGRDCWKY